MPQEVKIACDVKERLNISQMVELQGELKTLSEDGYKRLKTEILASGFAFPVYLWLEPGKKGKPRVVGGHQRIRCLKRMEAEGITIPPIPYVSVHAKNLKDAKRRVLQDVSQYGKLTHEGLAGFMSDAMLTFEDLSESFSLPDLNLDAFKADLFAKPGHKVEFIAGLNGEKDELSNQRKYKDQADKLAAYLESEIRSLRLTFPTEQYEALVAALDTYCEKHELDNYSDAVYNIITKGKRRA